MKLVDPPLHALPPKKSNEHYNYYYSEFSGKIHETFFNFKLLEGQKKITGRILFETFLFCVLIFMDWLYWKRTESVQKTEIVYYYYYCYHDPILWWCTHDFYELLCFLLLKELLRRYRVFKTVSLSTKYIDFRFDKNI